jgi:hypothetical protein
MLKNRILSTLKFFDLQDIPLTLLELHRFLLGDLSRIALSQDENWELFKDAPLGGARSTDDLDEILACIGSECKNEIESTLGYYHLPGRAQIVYTRWQNYFFGIKRERKIRKFLPFLRHLPFIRGVGVGGSQSLGQQRQESDIDLFVVAEPGFLWLARTLVSAYFQILGMRRHGRRIKNRFCLNHYVAGAKPVDRERNLYKAMEYSRLRSVVYPQGVERFLQKNQDWISVYCPNFSVGESFQAQSPIQKFLERLLLNPFGRVLEKFLGFWQKLKIRQDEFIFVLADELSFHPKSLHRVLLSKFFN